MENGLREISAVQPHKRMKRGNASVHLEYPSLIRGFQLIRKHDSPSQAAACEFQTTWNVNSESARQRSAAPTF